MLEGVNQFLSGGKALEPGNGVVLERVGDLVSELSDIGRFVHVPPEIPVRGHHKADTGTDRPQRRGWHLRKISTDKPLKQRRAANAQIDCETARFLRPPGTRLEVDALR